MYTNQTYQDMIDSAILAGLTRQEFMTNRLKALAKRYSRNTVWENDSTYLRYYDYNVYQHFSDLMNDKRRPNSAKQIRSSTAIFTVDWQKSTVTINNGDWYTSTTKKRINECFTALNLPFGVYQEDHCWFVRNHQANAVVPFKNFMSLPL